MISARVLLQLLLTIALKTIIVCVADDSSIYFKLTGNGFHRKLNYNVKIAKSIEQNCHVALYLELPSFVYVNIDEIADLRRLGIVNACSVGETDVELFAEKANTQNVTICSDTPQRQVTLQLPIHQRYHYPREGGGEIGIRLPPPKLLLGCQQRVTDLRVSTIDLCSPCSQLALKWREIPFKLEIEDYNWQIQLGDSSRYNIVAFVTLFTTSLGTIFVLRALWMSNTT